MRKKRTRLVPLKKSKTKTSTKKMVYKLDTRTCTIEPILSTDPNKIHKNYIYSNNYEELKAYKIAILLSMQKKIRHDLEKSLSFGEYFVKLRTGEIIDMNGSEYIEQKIDLDLPFAIVYSKKQAEELKNNIDYFKNSRACKYWTTKENSIFTNCLSSILILFGKNAEIIRIKKLKNLIGLLGKTETKFVKSHIRIQSDNKPKFQAKINEEYDAYNQKQEEFNKRNSELLNIIEARKEPSLTDIEILIPAPKGRQIKVK